MIIFLHSHILSICFLPLSPAGTCQQLLPSIHNMGGVKSPSVYILSSICRQQEQKENSSGNDNNKGVWQGGRNSPYHQPTLPSEVQSCTTAQSKDQSNHDLQLLIPKEMKMKVIQTLFQNTSDVSVCYKVSATLPYLKMSVVAKMFLFGY